MRTNLTTVLSILLFIITMTSSEAAVRKVPQDFAKIQTAINAAANGDTILVNEGMYSENLFITKIITLASLYLLDGDTAHISKTILDGSSPAHPDSGSVIFVGQGSDTTTLITGFTIQNGTGTANIPASDGTVWNAGGGIFCHKGGASIVRNIITNNVISRNRSTGGGICTWENTPYVIIRSNLIRENRSMSTEHGEDGGIDFGSSGEISNNIITRNEAGNGPCGGFSIWGSTEIVKVINNTVAFNTSYGGNEGAGLWFGQILLMNNIFWNPGDGIEVSGVDEILTASNNLIRGDYYGENHFSEPPAFADSSLLTLSTASPAISAGVMQKSLNGIPVTAPSKDFYGHDRSQPQNSPPDLGAVESPSSVSVPFTRAPQMTNRTIVVNGLTRRYIMFTPKNYAAGAPLPVIIFFHGSGGTCEKYLIAGFHIFADKERFIVIHPDSYTRPSRTWAFSSPATSDMNFINQLLDTLIKNFNVDSTRIFVGGKSNGASMTFWYASFYGQRVRAIAPVSNTIEKMLATPPKAIPMIYFFGTADNTVSYYGSSARHSAEAGTALWAGFNGCESTPLIENLPDIVPEDNSTVIKISYPKQGVRTPPVQLYKIVGGGHSMPGPQAWYSRPVNRDINGPEVIWSFFKDMSGITDVDDVVNNPSEFALSQNYPNPFNPSTTIRYSLPTSAKVKLTIHDILGREIATFVNEEQSAGWKEVEWNASNCASGMYLVRMQSGTFVETKKILLMK
jgi:polyhydroxybutyrate depolymerase